MNQIPPPPPAGPVAKKGMPVWGWILIGCGGLVIVGFLALGALGWFAVNKAKEVAAEFEENPTKAAAELVVKLNPDLELIESDEEAGTITIEQKSTGKIATFDYEELEQGRLSFETEDGTFEVDASQAGDDGEGVIRVNTGKGQMVLGGKGGLPAWISRYPGAQNETQVFHQTDADGETGAGAFEVADPAQTVHEWYKERLVEDGFELTNTSTFGGGNQWMGIVGGEKDGGKVTLTVSATAQDGKTQVAVQYQIRN